MLNCSASGKKSGSQHLVRKDFCPFVFSILFRPLFFLNLINSHNLNRLKCKHGSGCAKPGLTENFQFHIIISSFPANGTLSAFVVIFIISLPAGLPAAGRQAGFSIGNGSGSDDAD
jgi:hypothetical protein